MYSTLTSNATVTFDSMIKRFGVVTVMNARVFDAEYAPKTDSEVKDVAGIIQAYTSKKPICTLDTLKVANVTLEGPDKTVTGGQYSNPLIKYGKTARLEMQDALGNAVAIATLGGGILEADAEKDPNTDNSWSTTALTNTHLHIGETFVGPKTIIGDTFFIDQKSGQQVPVTIIFYQFLPDSLFNLTQDAEGDATVFDMNGDLLATNIKVGTGSETHINTGVFYSVMTKTSIGA